MSQYATTMELLNAALLTLKESLNQPDQTVRRIIAAYEAGYEKGRHADDSELQSELDEALGKIDALEGEQGALESDIGEYQSKSDRVREIVALMRAELARNGCTPSPEEKPFLNLFIALEKELNK
jgi:Arc/MetJ-type ribon-helix-helix transcriptional regulator